MPRLNIWYLQDKNFTLILEVHTQLVKITNMVFHRSKFWFCSIHFQPLWHHREAINQRKTMVFQIQNDFNFLKELYWGIIDIKWTTHKCTICNILTFPVSREWTYLVSLCPFIIIPPTQIILQIIIDILSIIIH